MAENETDLVLSWQPAGRNGTVVLTAAVGGVVIATDKLDVLKERSRRSFADALIEKAPGLDREAIDAELLRIAAEVADRPDPVDQPEGEEVTATAVHRPELFFTPEVCGTAIPSIRRRYTDEGEKLIGGWVQYLCWADGRRQKVPLRTTLETERGPIWFHPEPSEPGPHTPAGWSAESRRAWLSGSDPPAPVDVFRKMCEAIAFYVEFPKDEAPGTVATMALWAAMTYCYPCWAAVPYLYFGGTMGTGKTRCAEILAAMAFRPLCSSNVTGAALFRSLHDRGGTLVLDEAEGLRRGNDPAVGELLSILLAGYKRGGQATRLEKVGDAFRTVAFDVFGPKLIACIGGMPPALASRSLSVNMFRAPSNSPKPNRQPDADPSRWQAIRDDLYRMILSNGPALLDLPRRHDVCPEMSGRNRELWQPLLSLASWFEEGGAGGLLELMREHALRVVEDAKVGSVADCDEILLRAVSDAARRYEWSTAKEILALAKSDEPEAFTNWRSETVSVHLRRFGLKTVKSGSRREYRPDMALLLEIQKRYGVELNIEADIP